MMEQLLASALTDSDGLRVSQPFIRTANRGGDGAGVIQQQLHFKLSQPRLRDFFWESVVPGKKFETHVEATELNTRPAIVPKIAVVTAPPKPPTPPKTKVIIFLGLSLVAATSSSRTTGLMSDRPVLVRPLAAGEACQEITYK
jgi:hypothetical protein